MSTFMAKESCGINDSAMGILIRSRVCLITIRKMYLSVASDWCAGWKAIETGMKGHTVVLCIYVFFWCFYCCVSCYYLRKNRLRGGGLRNKPQRKAQRKRGIKYRRGRGRGREVLGLTDGRTRSFNYELQKMRCVDAWISPIEIAYILTSLPETSRPAILKSR